MPESLVGLESYKLSYENIWRDRTEWATVHPSRRGGQAGAFSSEVRLRRIEPSLWVPRCLGRGLSQMSCDYFCLMSVCQSNWAFIADFSDYSPTCRTAPC